MKTNNFTNPIAIKNGDEFFCSPFVICKETQDIGNVGSVETDLMSCVIKGGTITDNSIIRVTATGDFATAGGSRTVKLMLGSTVLLTTTRASSSAAGGFLLESIIKKTTDNEQSYNSEITMNSSGVLTADFETDMGNVTENFSQDLTLKVTGRSSADADDSIVNTTLVVEVV